MFRIVILAIFLAGSIYNATTAFAVQGVAVSELQDAIEHVYYCIENQCDFDTSTAEELTDGSNKGRLLKSLFLFDVNPIAKSTLALHCRKALFSALILFESDNSPPVR